MLYSQAIRVRKDADASNVNSKGRPVYKPAPVDSVVSLVAVPRNAQCTLPRNSSRGEARVQTGLTTAPPPIAAPINTMPITPPLSRKHGSLKRSFLSRVFDRLSVNGIRARKSSKNLVKASRHSHTQHIINYRSRIHLTSGELFALLSSFSVVLAFVFLALVHVLPDDIVFKDQHGFRKRLEQKADILTEQIAKNREIEDQLKLRAAGISSLMEGVKGLEFDMNGLSGRSRPAKAKVRNNPFSFSRGGMGGADQLHAPLISRQSGSKTTGKMLSHSALNVAEKLDLQLERLKRVPIGIPIVGNVTSGYGWRVSPFDGKRVHMHDGVDIAVETRSHVISAADGIVIDAGPKGAYGRAVVIDHGDGIETLYGHLSGVSVEIGQKVCRGQQIGFVGSTGRSTGPHLHYEVRVNGVAKNPVPFIELAQMLQVLS